MTESIVLHWELDDEVEDDTAFARAWRSAEEAAEDKRRRQEEQAALESDVEDYSYDPRPAPIDTRMYEATGIGALYGDRGSRMAWVVPVTCDAPAGMVVRGFDLSAEVAGWRIPGLS